MSSPSSEILQKVYILLANLRSWNVLLEKFVAFLAENEIIASNLENKSNQQVFLATLGRRFRSIRSLDGEYHPEFLREVKCFKITWKAIFITFIHVQPYFSGSDTRNTTLALQEVDFRTKLLGTFV